MIALDASGLARIVEDDARNAAMLREAAGVLAELRDASPIEVTVEPFAEPIGGRPIVASGGTTL